MLYSCVTPRTSVVTLYISTEKCETIGNKQQPKKGDKEMKKINDCGERPVTHKSSGPQGEEA